MNNKTILLVEDNPNDIGLTRRAFEKCRIYNDLIVKEDGKEALDYLYGVDGKPGAADNGLPMLVMLDLKLPRIDGLEILRKIRGDVRTHRMPVVILTSSKEEEDVAASYDLGANSYIRKPVDFQQFAQAVQNLGLYWLVLNEPPPKVK
ncbi:MAG TPA: response regulator [Candidatus Ozemobacteraceae bacterium]|nr:response regulator [Candidatus Ozemobacteraceae bacterium]